MTDGKQVRERSGAMLIKYLTVTKRLGYGIMKKFHYVKDEFRPKSQKINTFQLSST